MKIEDIIYHTTRPLLNVEDKLRIATIFIFCWKMNSKLFAELLYSKDSKKFIKKLNSKYLSYDVDFFINLSDKNIKECFYNTLVKVKEKYDSDGYYNALYNKDEYALAINDIVENIHWKDSNFISFKESFLKYKNTHN